jgi:hypothetical protein
VLSERLGIFVFVVISCHPPRQQSKTDCHACEKGPEPGETSRVGYFCRIRNVAKRGKPDNRNAEAYGRENCRNNHRRLD